MRPKTAEDALDLVKEQQRGEIVVVESEGLLSTITIVERAYFAAEGPEHGRKASRSLLQVARYGLITYELFTSIDCVTARVTASLCTTFRYPNYNCYYVDFELRRFHVIC